MFTEFFLEKTMKVLMLIQDFYPATGGAERQCLKLSEELTRQGIAVNVLTRQFSANDPKEDWIRDVRVVRLKKIRPFEAAVIYWLFQLWKYRKDFDVFHLHMVNEHTLAAIIVGVVTRKPVIIKFANSGVYFDVRRVLQYGRRPVNKIIARSLKYADRLISITPAVTRDIDEYGYDSKKVEIIPNGVEDIQRLTPEEKRNLRRKLGIPEDAIVFLRIGSFLPKKGVSILCTSWETVREQCKNSYLLSVGGSAIPSEIDTFSSKYKDSTMFVLNQPDGVKNYLQIADVFVLPSLAEGLSNALLEALSAGLPAIVTNVGGNSELVSSGLNGVVVDPEDHKALSQAMIELATDSQKREDMSNQASSKLSKYSIESVAKRYIHLYSQLVAEKAKKS